MAYPKLTPIKKIKKYYCKIERSLPSGSVKIRGAYHLLYRLLEKKRHQGGIQLNVVIPAINNFSLACLEALKVLKEQLYKEQSQAKQSSEIIQDDTPTDPGLSLPITDKELSSRFLPFEPLGEMVIFGESVASSHIYESYSNVRVFHASKRESELQAFDYAQGNDYEFLDQYNNIDAIAGYATIGFEIE